MNNKHIINIQEKYRVQIILKRRPKLHPTIVLVKGVEWELEFVKEATLVLMNKICGKLAVSVFFFIILLFFFTVFILE